MKRTSSTNVFMTDEEQKAKQIKNNHHSVSVKIILMVSGNLFGL